MDVVLKVLAGAKKGTKIAVKKDEFLIGRSQKCHLCVGSNSISRKHCAILRGDASVRVKDLGSRNGTLINGKRITEEVELCSGDELEVGPLRFLVTISPGISNRKRPHVKSVADAVERAAETQPVETDEDDISNWLLGPASPTATETQTIHMDDTNAIQADLAAAQEQANPATDTTEDASSEPAAEDEEKPKGPGKLPLIPPADKSKNSGEAAENALRAWNRRR